MAGAEGHPPQRDVGEASFAQEAEELFATLAAPDGAMRSEAASALVSAMDFLGVPVSEAQVTVAIQAVAPATEDRLTKSEFLHLVESLRRQPFTTEGGDSNALEDNEFPDARSSTLIDGDSSITTTVGAEGSPHAEADVAVTFVFEPRVPISSFKGDARSSAEQVYATIEPTMLEAIEEGVDTGLQIFMSMLPDSLSGDDKVDFQKTS